MTSHNPAIRVSYLGKKYQICGRHAQYLSDSDAIINTVNLLMNVFQRDYQDEGFRALWDISFDVETGEVVGIIGHNNDRKSMLFKILSLITTPIDGTVELHDRVGSLLEVGTGYP